MCALAVPHRLLLCADTLGLHRAISTVDLVVVGSAYVGIFDLALRRHCRIPSAVDSGFGLAYERIEKEENARQVCVDNVNSLGQLVKGFAPSDPKRSSWNVHPL